MLQLTLRWLDAFLLWARCSKLGRCFFGGIHLLRILHSCSSTPKRAEAEAEAEAEVEAKVEVISKQNQFLISNLQ